MIGQEQFDPDAYLLRSRSWQALFFPQDFNAILAVLISFFISELEGFEFTCKENLSKNTVRGWEC